MGCFISGNKISIGNNTVINRNCFLDGRYQLHMGNNVSISPNVFIISLSHDKNSSCFSTIGKTVFIDDYVWVGIGAFILPGVSLNKGCIVGAGSVVIKEVKTMEIVCGNPAKFIGNRECNLSYSLSYFPFLYSDVLL
ncbi:MAG: acyltransferase [Paludibacteraceae bacterium]|nr:acyltransferase [Paludibacteraceae bacterium]